jgi:type I restriction enzyme S subunit
VDGGGKLFYRPKHKFSVTNVGGTLRILDSSFLSIRYLFFVLTLLHSKIKFDWVFKAHPSVLRKVYNTIPIPDLNTQLKLVEKFDKAFIEIDSLEKNLQLKEEKTNQLLQSMLSAAFTNTGKFDMKIIESTLGDLCEVDWGNTNLTKSSYVPDGKFLAISASGPDGRIDHYEHEGNIPVLSAIGAQCGKMFFPTEKFTAIKNTITLTPLKDVVDGKYLYYLFTHIELPQRGAGQPFISKGDIQGFKISIPKEVEDQRVIVNILDDAFAEIDNLRNQFSIEKELVASLRQSILSNAFKFEEKAA